MCVQQSTELSPLRTGQPTDNDSTGIDVSLSSVGNLFWHPYEFSRLSAARLSNVLLSFAVASSCFCESTFFVAEELGRVFEDFAGPRAGAFLVTGSPLPTGLITFEALVFALRFGCRRIDIVGSGNFFAVEGSSELARKRSYPEGSEFLGMRIS